MRLIGLRCGGLRTDIGGLLTGQASDVVDVIPVMCFAVDTGNGVAVFDTGLHEDCCSGAVVAHFGERLLKAFEPVCDRHALVDERLRQAGIATDDVAWVTNSHLHFDHAGRNAAFQGSHHLVRAREFEHGRSRQGKGAGFLPSELDEVEPLIAPWDYDDQFEIAHGVVLHDASGHTLGHQRLDVSFDDGRRFVCIGDAAYTLEAVESLTPTGFVWDRDRVLATLHALRTESNDGAVLLTAHDIDQWRDVQDVVDIHTA